jgi:acyl-CoA dehydrogenase
MNFSLTSDQRELQDRARAFREEELGPLEADFLAAGALATETRRALEHRGRERGLWALEVPHELGGAGRGQLDMCLVHEELYKSPIMFEFGGSPEPCLYLCNEDQMERYFHPVVRGEKHSAYAFTEPGTGSDLAGLETTAVADGDDFIVNGTKKFIGFVQRSEFVITFVSTEPAAGARGVSCLLVDTDAPGFAIVRSLPTMGDDWEPYELSFTDCRVRGANLLGALNGGFAVAADQLTHGRLKIAAFQLGLASRSLEIAVAYAKRRHTWGKPLASRQGLQFMLADSEVELHAARLLVHRAAWMADAAEPMRNEAFMAKLYATEMAQRVTDRCLQIQGGEGYLRESPLQSFFRQARLWRIGHGTSEIHRWMIARNMLSLRADD